MGGEWRVLRSMGRVPLGLGCEGELALCNFASFGPGRKLDAIVQSLVCSLLD